jgi:hypothetical protein
MSGRANYGRDNTFVTGGGLPGKVNSEKAENEPEEFDQLEDKLINQTDKFEKEFAKMMG